MTKKEFLELEQFKALPDDAEIVFRTSKYPQKRVPLTVKHCSGGMQWTNREFIENQPINVQDYIEKKIWLVFNYRSHAFRLYGA